MAVLCFWASDFETTSTGSGQTSTEVWAAGLSALWRKEVKIFNNIKDWFYYLASEDGDQTVYFHNLKFDGSFIVDWLLRNGYEVAHNGEAFLKPWELPLNTFITSISDKNVWYQIVIKTEYGNLLRIRDSFKRLPSSLERLAKDLQTSVQKLEIDYIGERKAGGPITEEEKRYLSNDVIILREALEKTLGVKPKLTIGSECLAEYKNDVQHWNNNGFRGVFPDLSAKPAGDTGLSQHLYCLNGYKGGWCYVPRNASHVKKPGRVLDANSLYPSRMHSASGCRYPVGVGEYYKGAFPSFACDSSYYGYVRFKCRFQIRHDKLPTVQIKGNPFYRYNEWQKTSDILWDGKYYDYYKDEEGIKKPAEVTFTMTGPDFEKFLENYETRGLEVIDSLVFRAEYGMFDEYIEKYNKLKVTATNPTQRLIGKLMNNNLYGQFARTDDSSYKLPVLVDGIVRYISMTENKKEVGYMPVGAAITSWARLHTITHAEKLGPAFCYSDTDSLHFTGYAPIGFDIDSKRLGAWKQEREFEEAFFSRQKTYIEKCGDEYNLVCAGMGERAKENFIDAVRGEFRDGRKYERDEIAFIKSGKKMTDLAPGLIVPGNLKGKRIAGGTVLFRQPYEMKDVIYLR